MQHQGRFYFTESSFRSFQLFWSSSHILRIGLVDVWMFGWMDECFNVWVCLWVNHPSSLRFILCWQIVQGVMGLVPDPAGGAGGVRGVGSDGRLGLQLHHQRLRPTAQKRRRHGGHVGALQRWVVVVGIKSLDQHCSVGITSNDY